MTTISYKCATCGAPAEFACQFPLLGKKRGQTCGRSVCRKHMIRRKSGKALCLAHSHYTVPVMTKTAELSQIQFIVPIERQLPAAKEPPARPVDLTWIKKAVEILTGEKAGSRGFAAGVVMLAPIECGFKADNIVVLTKYGRGVVERYIGNLLRYGIWKDECWHCEWGEIFTGEELSDERAFELSVSFVLDALVAEGSISRDWREDGPYYQHL
jgi:DNA-directed RNA polymerase subunit RPC12/RpoP